MSMHEPHTVAALIERIVAEAQIPSSAEREDLKRELWTHFEDAGASPEALHEAMRRFGAEAAVTESFRRVYRWDYRFLYLAKIAASVLASLAAALLIEVLVNLRVEMHADVWRLAPGFSHAAPLSIAVVLALVTAWEVLTRLGVRCSKLEPRPATLLVLFAVFTAAEYGTHVMKSVAFGPGRALLASAVLVAVCATTVLIVTRVDDAFVSHFA